MSYEELAPSHQHVCAVDPWWPLQAKVALFLNASVALFFLVFATTLGSASPLVQEQGSLDKVAL